jgi:cell division protein FtsW
MRKLIGSDRVLLTVTLILVSIGLVTVYTASAAVSIKYFGVSNVFFKKDLFNCALGLVALAAAAVFDYRRTLRWSKLLMLGSLILLGGLFFFDPKRGAQSWYPFPVIQPVEIAKLALVIYLADVIGRRKIKDFTYGVLPRFVATAFIVVPVAIQPDLGSALAVALLAAVVIFVGGAKIWHMAVGALGAAAGFAIAVLRSDTAIERIITWKNLWLDPTKADVGSAAYQSHQSIVAIGSGGFLGNGLGLSRQRCFLPDPHTDFPFSIIGEELGFLGTVGVIVLFGVLIWRGFRIARNCYDHSSFLLATGLTLMIAIYAVVNIAVATRIIPITGLPLPFISYGGSSLFVNLAAVGILLNMSSHTVLK